MKLIVHELKASGLEQVITPNSKTVVKAIRPHLYRHGSPSGSLKLEVYDSEAALVATSESINISAIGSMSYFHGYVRFYLDAYLKKDSAYTVKLVSTGYTFNESAYIGWVNGHDLSKYPLSEDAESTYNYPLDLEVWEVTVK